MIFRGMARDGAGWARGGGGDRRVVPLQPAGRGHCDLPLPEMSYSTFVYISEHFLAFSSVLRSSLLSNYVVRVPLRYWKFFYN